MTNIEYNKIVRDTSYVDAYIMIEKSKNELLKYDNTHKLLPNWSCDDRVNAIEFYEFLGFKHITKTSDVLNDIWCINDFEITKRGVIIDNNGYKRGVIYNDLNDYFGWYSSYLSAAFTRYSAVRNYLGESKCTFYVHDRMSDKHIYNSGVVDTTNISLIDCITKHPAILYCKDKLPKYKDYKSYW